MQKSYYGTGRRKTSIAKVRLTEGTGKITVNGRDVNEFFPFETFHFLNHLEYQFLRFF